MITIISSLLLSFSSQAFNVDTVLKPFTEEAKVDDPWPNKPQVEEQMKLISDNLAKGTLPEPGTTTEFYSGSCITSYSASVVPPIYSATVALRKSDDGLQIAYTTGQGTYKKYTAADLPSLDVRYTPKTKPFVIMPTELGGEYLQFTMAPKSAQLPAIMSALSIDKQNPSKMYFVAMLMGYYCELDRVQ